MPTITINENTRLDLTAEDVDNGNKVYSEVYFGFETGNTVAVPLNATPAEVVEAYVAA